MRKWTAYLLAAVMLLSAAFAPVSAAAEDLGAVEAGGMVAAAAGEVLITAEDGAEVGKTLVAPEGGTAYQWKRSDTYNGTYSDIADAEEGTYVVQQEDFGKYIKVEMDGTLSTNFAVGGNLAFGIEGIAGYSAGDRANGPALTDGNYSTKSYAWGGTKDVSVIADLGSEQAVNQFRVRVDANGNIKSYKVQYTTEPMPSEWGEKTKWWAMDSDAWTTVATGTDTSKWSEKTFDFFQVNARYVRFCITDVTSTSTSFYVQELEAFKVQRTEPLMQLNGEADMRVLLGSEFVDPGAQAQSTDGDDISEQIEVVGSIDTKKLGTQTLEYKLDGAQTLTRKVTVYAEPVKITASNGTEVGAEIAVSYENGTYDSATFQWQRSDKIDSGYEDIAGKTGTTYTLAEEDTGKYVRVAAKLGEGIDAVYSSNVIGTGNLAFGKEVTLSYAPGGGTAAANLTDGDITTYVRTGSSKTGNVTHAVDLGSKQKIDRVIMRNYTGSPCILTYKVQYTNTAKPEGEDELKAWNDVNSESWTDVVTEEPGKDEKVWTTKTIDFEPVEAQYVRFCVLEVSQTWNGVFNLREMEVYCMGQEDPGPVDPPVGDKPVITLNGDATMYVAKGTVFEDPGATATNTEESVVVTGTVDTTRASVYQLKYDVNSGDVAADTVVRTVIVYDGDAVWVSAPDGTGEGAVLRGAYKADYDAAGTAYQWQSADAIDGTFADIDGANGKTYTIKDTDYGKYLRLVVTPSGGSAVTASNSAAAGNLVAGLTAVSNTALHSDPSKTAPISALTDGTTAAGISHQYGSTSNVSYMFDLGSVQKVNEMVVYENHTGGGKVFDFCVQVSNKTEGRDDAIDSEDWTTVAQRTDESNWKKQVLEFAAVDARYIRFCITRVNSAGPLYSLREIEVFHRPQEKPVIYLAGDAEMRHPYGKPFVDPGYSATGSDGGDVTGQVKVEGSVDVYQLGEQTLTYTLEGADSVTRTVTVYAEPLSITAADGMGCGKTLTASYANGAYDGATFQWSISATATGTYTPIDGETGKTYTIRDTDMGNYIRVSVTLDGGGAPIQSGSSVRVGNLAYGKEVTLDYTPYNTTAANLTDGNMDTYVRTQYSKTAGTHAVDLGSAQYIDQVTLYNYATTEVILGYKVQYTNVEKPTDSTVLKAWAAQNSEDWIDVTTVAYGDNPADTGYDNENWATKTIAFEPVKARYIRFCATEINQNWSGVFNLKEMEVMNSHAQPKAVITLNGAAVMDVQKGDPFTDPGATAIAADGFTSIPVTVGGDKVDTNVVKTYVITYDAEGADQVTRTVRVVEAKPVITLKGEATMELYVGDTYTDPGATVQYEGGGLSDSDIVVGGDTVDTTTPGTYTVTYDVSAPDGTAAEQVVRTVIVHPLQLDVTAPNGTSIRKTLQVAFANGEAPEGATYQWMRASEIDGEYQPIENATSATYRLADEDRGNYVRVAVTVPGGKTASMSRNAVGGGDLLFATQPGVTGGTEGTSDLLTDGRTDTGMALTAASAQIVMNFAATSEVNTLRVHYLDGSAQVTDYTLEYQQTADGAWTEIDTQDSALAQVSFDNIQAAALRLTIHAAEAEQVAISGVEAYRRTKPPVITLNGEADMTVPQGITFTDPGAVAVDENGDDLSDDIVVTGEVDTATIGDYVLTYDVKDSTGTAAEPVQRTVHVVDGSIDLAWDDLNPGSELRVTYTWDGYSPENADYQWVRSSSINSGFEEIPGATGATYTMTPADRGNYIKVTVSSRLVSGAMATPSHGVACGNLAAGKKTESDANANLVDSDFTTEVKAYSTTVNVDYDVDLGETQDINRIRIYNSSAKPKLLRFQLYYTASATPGDSDWIQLADIQDSSNWTVQDISFDRVQARKVRMHAAEIDTAWSGAFSIRELEVYNKPVAAPTLTLNGESEMMVEVGSEFVDPGVTATDETGLDLSALVTVSGDTVDTDTIGTYTLVYNVDDGYGNTAPSVTRTVTVHEVDTQPPVIYLNGAAKVRVHQNSVYEDAGAYALDNIDPNVEVVVGGDTVNTAELGDYTITYDAVDQKGNRAVQKTRTVSVVLESEDVVPPVVTLNGEAEVEVWQGYTYEEAGAKATDDGVDVTSKITVEGTVDTDVLGDYVITYSVTDAAGNIGVASRMVHVIPEPAIERDTRELQIEGASNLNAVTSDLILRIKGTYGSTITWTSSNESVIRPDGTVIRPTQDASVVLTATITNGDEVRTKTFDAVIVKGTGSGSGGSGGGGGGGRPSSGGSTVTGTGGGTVTTPSTPQTTPDPSGNGTLSGYSDMDQAVWADLAVSELSKRGILSGMGDGTFQPNRAVTREEFVKIIVEAFSLYSETATASFSDVPENEWYYSYVASAAQNGIVDGIGGSLFGTGQDITREEMAAMICRAVQVKGIELSADKDRQTFTDDSAISDWAKENVYALQQAGVISGMGDGTFAPAQQCTRAEAAKVVYEVTKLIW